MSTEKTSKGISRSVGGHVKTTPIPESVRNFRKARGWNQSQLADACGVTQSQVSRWEKGLDRPSPAALSAIAELADDAERSTWLEAAGIAQFAQQLPEDVRVVPVLKDAAAAGTPRAIDPANVERTIALPSAWLPPGGKLYAIPVVGDSMSPTITEGNLVLIDISQKSAKNLIDWMVAAKDAEGGVTIKYLRHDGDLFFLVPEHTSVRHPIKIMRSEGDWSIVGKVVKIIADPPSPRRK